jgi:hypothetical protein
MFNNYPLSDMAEDMVAEFPAIRSLNTLSILDIIMPSIYKIGTSDYGWDIYRYTATIREMTRD